MVIVLSDAISLQPGKTYQIGLGFFQLEEQSYKGIWMPKDAPKMKIHEFFLKLMVISPSSMKLVLASELHSLNMMVKVHQQHFLLPSVISWAAV